MKKKSRAHITTTDRQQINLYLREKKSHRTIARLIGKNRSAIDCEVARNTVSGSYAWKKADQKARNRRKDSKYQGMKIVHNPALWQFVISKLQTDWSPEEISGRLRYKEKELPYVSGKGIYRFIRSAYGGSLSLFLRYGGRKRKSGKSPKGSGLTDRVFIDRRPKIIEKRARFGDWEGILEPSGQT